MKYFIQSIESTISSLTLKKTIRKFKTVKPVKIFRAPFSAWKNMNVFYSRETWIHWEYIEQRHGKHILRDQTNFRTFPRTFWSAQIIRSNIVITFLKVQTWSMSPSSWSTFQVQLSRIGGTKSCVKYFWQFEVFHNLMRYAILQIFWNGSNCKIQDI